jgi:hypothetical protein
MCTPCTSCFDQVIVPSWQASLIATGVALATTVALCALAAHSIHTIAGVSLLSLIQTTFMMAGGCAIINAVFSSIIIGSIGITPKP